jgi:TolB-like protein
VGQPPSSFGRGKGTFFLVDRKSRAVIWSTYDRAANNSADTLDKKAEQIVNRLKRDLLPKETK